MLSYNIVTGSIDIVHTHFVSKIDTDLAEQALRSRPRNESGGALRDGVRARANRFPDATQSIYHGSGPGFPLFYGRYKKNHPSDPTAVTQEYLDGSVPEDKLSDVQSAELAGAEFSPEIVRALTAENLKPDSPGWRQRYSDLKLKYGFDVPFYRRMAEVYAEKYKDIQWWEKWPSPYNKDYLEECRLDVYDWYVEQPPGYKLELEGDAKFWYGDQSDEMQERIARECAVVLGGIHEVDAKAKEVDEANQKAFKDAMERTYNAERDLLATKGALTKRIQEDEETAAGALDQKALELADKHKTYFSMSYPFTYATQEFWPVLQFDMRSLPTHVKQPAEIALDQTITDVTVGAPLGWAPGKDYEAKFKPDAKGWVAYRPVTVKMNFAAKLLDADQKPAAQATLDLPVVLYEPSFDGQISVAVYARGASGDSSLYSGAAVTVDSTTMTTEAHGGASFLHLAAGTHAVKVAPSKGDERHGPGEGSASLVDALVTNKDIIGSERGGQQAASVTVTLPYMPEPVAVADQKKTGDAGGGKEAKKDSATAGQAGGNDSAKAATDSTKAKSDSAKAKKDSVKATDDSVTVPDVTGIADAKRRESVLAAVGLKGAYEAAGNPPSKERALTVAGQKPKGGARARRGDVVTISVYQQFTEDSVTVPDLSAFTDGSEMQAVLRHAGLEPRFVTPLPAPSKDQEFKLASQKPAAGAQVPRGTVDTLTAYGRFIGIPNLLGMTSGEAAAQLQPLGLVVAAIDSGATPPSADQAGRIYEQIPASGAPTPVDKRVTLRQYGSGRQVPPSGDWAGSYEQEGSTTVISGSTAGLSASFTYQVGGSKGSGSWSSCQVEGNTAKCKWTAQHEDETKSGTRSGDVQVTLSGTTITGAYYENEPVFSYKEGYSAATVSSSMHEGATWPINATRK